MKNRENLEKKIKFRNFRQFELAIIMSISSLCGQNSSISTVVRRFPKKLPPPPHITSPSSPKWPQKFYFLAIAPQAVDHRSGDLGAGCREWSICKKCSLRRATKSSNAPSPVVVGSGGHKLDDQYHARTTVQLC